ncbi:MAG: ABC transporter ATP-binding protein [Flavobacteriia bacterium]|nr:MAG: ABC transporter ATP-binding protein [Flavobacteriia bacterium]
MLEINAIHKSFKGKKVIKGVSTQFEKGKTSMIIGQSGSGKTVMMKCMLGLFIPEEGEISYDGRVFKNMNENERRDIRKDIGMVFQGSALYDFMTVEENVMFPLKMFTKRSKPEMLERVNAVLDRVDLSGTNGLLPSELSGGMKKRVAIARAIVMNPKYLFCDEPNSGLDPKTAIIIDNLIQEITREYDIITVINSHDMNSVMEIGDKIVFLKDGLKAWEGSKYNIFETDNQAVVDFVYSSELYKKVRATYLKDF